MREAFVAETDALPPHDVVVEFAASTTCEEVVTALVGHLGLTSSGQIHALCRRTETWLTPGQLFADSGLLAGDRLFLSSSREAPRHPGGRARYELAVVGGPLAGTRLPLREGPCVVGRGAESDITLEDSSMSRKHFEVTVGASTTVADAGSRNGTAVEGRLLSEREAVTLEEGSVVRAGRSFFTVAPARSAPASATTSFNRPPRAQRRAFERKITLPDPPEDPEQPHLPMAASLAPIGLALVLWPFFGPTMLAFAAAAPLMAIWTFLEERRGGAKGFARSSAEFRANTAAEIDALRDALAEEVKLRRELAPDADGLVSRAVERLPTLWERRPSDPTFLDLRVGTWDAPSWVEVELPDAGIASLRDEAASSASQYRIAAAVPCVVSLRAEGPLGIAGSGTDAVAVARFAVVQVATLHSPRDVVVAAALSEDAVDAWRWLSWLPHVRAETTPLNGPQLVAGDVAARQLLTTTRELVAARRKDAESPAPGVDRHWTHDVVLVVDGKLNVPRAAVAEIATNGPGVGVHLIWIDQTTRHLPGECGAIVEADGEIPQARVTKTRTSVEVTDVTVDRVSEATAREVALALAPIQDTAAQARGGVIPERTTLLPLLGLDAPTPRAVGELWDRAGPLSAPLGVTAEGTFCVDLRADGPHGLIAGTTGSGKSELLQTLVASLAATVPPTRLNFLLIDYKGGAAFKDCVRLPHVVGFVTDLDAHLTRRALVSLNAELRRREMVLRDAGAKDLLDMEQRSPDSCPPTLVLVIDEFATLAKEVPDFVEGVVDVAQRGRSLGIHLVLATQRPAGVVSENIRANTNLRIALRVSDRADSDEVIAAPDASRIPRTRPGRAYARTGHSELVELQTAFVGGAVHSGEEPSDVLVRELGFGEIPADPAARVDAGKTELELLVEVVEAAALDRDLPAQPAPWVPPLPEVLSVATLPAGPGRDGAGVIGLVDEPHRQRQRPLVLELDVDGSALVFGASGAGKTTLLRTVAATLATTASPDDLHLYGLDFAGRGLSSLADLPHCAAVVAGEDEERVRRVFFVVRRELTLRKELFARSRAFDLAEYRHQTGQTMPRIVVLFDGYGGFASLYERFGTLDLVESLPQLIGEGRPLGIHFIVTADRRGTVPAPLAGVVSTKLILRLGDDDEYSALGLDLRKVRGASLPPGRGFLPDATEFQIALVGGETSADAQIGALAAVAESVAAASPGRRAPELLTLAYEIGLDVLTPHESPLVAALAVADETLDSVHVDLRDGNFLVTGPYRSGRSTALGTLARMLAAAADPPELRLLAPRRSPLVELQVWVAVAAGAEECEEAASLLVEELESGEARGRPLVVFVDDAEELAETAAGLALETAVRRARDAGVRFVAAVERQAATRSYGTWISDLRKDQQGLLLSPDVDTDGDLLGVRLPQGGRPITHPGRGYVAIRGVTALVQVANGLEPDGTSC